MVMPAGVNALSVSFKHFGGQEGALLVHSHSHSQTYMFSKTRHSQSIVVLSPAHPSACCAPLGSVPVLAQPGLTGREDLRAAVWNPWAVACCSGLSATPACTLWKAQHYLWSFLVVAKSLAEPHFFKNIFGNIEVCFGLNRKHPPWSHVFEYLVPSGRRCFWKL